LLAAVRAGSYPGVAGTTTCNLCSCVSAALEPRRLPVGSRLPLPACTAVAPAVAVPLPPAVSAVLLPLAPAIAAMPSLLGTRLQARKAE
jgi:hypothetical protein